MQYNGRFAVVLLLVALLFVPVTGAWSGQYVTILHFNDFHGHLLPRVIDDKGTQAGGMARMATMVRETRAYNDTHDVETLLLCAGDVLQGTPMSSAYLGEPDFLCMNIMGVDAMCVGNHEFDFGQPTLLERVMQAAFPVLAANIMVEETGRPLVTPYVVRELGRETAAIVGLTTPDTRIESHHRNVMGLSFEDPAATMRRILPKITPRTNFIIALTHQGLDADRRLAAAIPEIDVIIGGHTHDALYAPEKVANALICQAGSEARYLGQLDAYVEDGAIVKYRGFLREVRSDIKEAPDIKAIVDRYHEKLRRDLEQVLAHTSVHLEGDRDIIRNQETNLGNMITDALRAHAQTDMVLLNSGGIRASVNRGPITLGDFQTVMPFDNELVVMRLTGAQVLEALHHSASMSPDDGGFLQVSGLSFVIRGKDVEQVMVGKSPLEADKTYTVATSDFLQGGGNGYEVFTRAQDPKILAPSINSILITYLTTKKTVAPELEGRIRRIR